MTLARAGLAAAALAGLAAAFPAAAARVPPYRGHVRIEYTVRGTESLLMTAYDLRGGGTGCVPYQHVEQTETFNWS